MNANQKVEDKLIQREYFLILDILAKQSTVVRTAIHSIATEATIVSRHLASGLIVCIVGI